MLARILSAAVQGIEGYPVWVEVDFRFGMPSFTIVGLPDAGVRESRDRVVTAIKNSGFTFPSHRITVNLAPADVRKEGPAFDLPMAIGVMVASELLSLDCVGDYAFLGELGLNGDIRPVRGVLPCALRLSRSGLKGLLVPEANAREAALVDSVPVFPVKTLQEAVRFLLENEKPAPFWIDRAGLFNQARASNVDFADVKGQHTAKRALEIAAAGGHNILMIGPPGSGKTLLARRLSTILPDLTFDEALETTKIHSVAGVLPPGEALIATRPFRSPHHQVSNVALIGGGAHPRPGEVSLAHRGVLFLDEFPEFGRHVLEGLRQPLEDRMVTIVRVASAVSFPSDFLLVAAANPCPCGYLGSPSHACVCTPFQLKKYRNRISGPLMDRIDLHVDVPALQVDELMDPHRPGEPSAAIRQRVQLARRRQADRLSELGLFENAQMNTRQIQKFCPIGPEGKQILRKAIHAFGLSARAYDRILRVGRTIADLEGSEGVQPAHLAEAISFRFLDRCESPPISKV